MTRLFETQPVRAAARRGSSSVRIRRSRRAEPWPPPDRDPVDAALVAVRLLKVTGRIRGRLRSAARAEAADLIDKLTSAIDEREVVCRLSLAGRAAVTRSLDSLRPIASGCRTRTTCSSGRRGVSFSR